MQRLALLFPASAAGWVLLIAGTAAWAHVAPAQGLPPFRTDLAGPLVLLLLLATLVGGLALARPQPSTPASPTPTKEAPVKEAPATEKEATPPAPQAA